MRHHGHLSDHDLVLALDGELSTRRQAAADAHLAECESCRDRQTQFDRGTGPVAALYRASVPDSEPIEVSRAKLRSNLAGVDGSRDGSLVGRLVFPFEGPSLWAALGVAVLAVVLLVAVTQRSVSLLTADSVPIGNGALPIASLTPGATWNLTADELCAPVRHEQRPVSDAIRLEVLRAYGMERVPADEYELDYLVTPELGGAPAVQNLWPQRYASRTWNAHVKDRLEQLLPKLVCDGTVSLQTAQRAIADDWIAAYKKYFRTETPLQMHASLREASLWESREGDVIEYPVWRTGNAPALKLISFSPSR